jgi:ribosomal protein S18 acetylase RimI-like enzyme
MPRIDLVHARSDAEYAAARALFGEYASQLGIDLCFQNFAFELDHLAEMYGAPAGCLLLGRADDLPVACVGVRRLSDDACEMKRLYVRAQVRGAGLGRQLALAAVAEARARGYQRMVLDTLAGMTAARRLYTSLGFREAAPYYANPLPEVVYMELKLNTTEP